VHLIQQRVCISMLCKVLVTELDIFVYDAKHRRNVIRGAPELHKLTSMLAGLQQRTSENHVGYKPPTTTTTTTTTVGSTSGAGDRGTLIQCNSSGVPYDVERIEQLTDTASLSIPGPDTPRSRPRTSTGILRHKETNF